MKNANRLLCAAAAAGVALLLGRAAGGQVLPDAETREVRAYTLTEAGLEKYVAATRKLSGIRLSCADDEPGVDSLAAAAAKIDAVPGARAAVQSAGMTSREYVVFAFALIENAIAAYALEQPGGALPPGISMGNVEFFREHAAEMEKLASETEDAGCAEDVGGGGATPLRAAARSTP